MKTPQIRTGKRGWRTTLHAFYYMHANSHDVKQTRMILYRKQSSNPGDASPTAPLPHSHSSSQPFVGGQLTLPEARTAEPTEKRGLPKTQIIFGSIQGLRTVNGIDCYRKP
jgi:hypothetical protein